MKRVLLMSAFLGTFLAGVAGVATAETPPPPRPQAAPAAHDHAAPARPGEGGESKMMCGHMMGGGGGGMGMGMGGMGPMMMGGPGTKVAVKNVDKGVTITLTATDAAGAVRLQKMAEAMRLMHEAMTPEK